MTHAKSKLAQLTPRDVGLLSSQIDLFSLAFVASQVAAALLDGETFQPVYVRTLDARCRWAVQIGDGSWLSPVGDNDRLQEEHT